MSRGNDRLVALGAISLYAALCVRHRADPRPAELRLFRRINASPDHRWHRIPQQLGTPRALPAASAALALGRRADLALAAVAALPLEKGAEVLTKKLVRRPRPVTLDSAVLRDDAPREGPALPSGHAAIAAAASYLLARGSGSVAVAGFGATATALASYVRVHQGAHWPGDVAAGAALGVAIGAAVTAAAGRLES